MRTPCDDLTLKKIQRFILILKENSNTNFINVQALFLKYLIFCNHTYILMNTYQINRSKNWNQNMQIMNLNNN